MNRSISILYIEDNALRRQNTAEIMADGWFQETGEVASIAAPDSVQSLESILSDETTYDYLIADEVLSQFYNEKVNSKRKDFVRWCGTDLAIELDKKERVKTVVFYTAAIDLGKIRSKTQGLKAKCLFVEGKGEDWENVLRILHEDTIQPEFRSEFNRPDNSSGVKVWEDSWNSRGYEFPKSNGPSFLLHFGLFRSMDYSQKRVMGMDGMQGLKVRKDSGLRVGFEKDCFGLEESISLMICDTEKKNCTSSELLSPSDLVQIRSLKWKERIFIDHILWRTSSWIYNAGKIKEVSTYVADFVNRIDLSKELGALLFYVIMRGCERKSLNRSSLQDSLRDHGIMLRIGEIVTMEVIDENDAVALCKKRDVETGLITKARFNKELLNGPSLPGSANAWPFYLQCTYSMDDQLETLVFRVPITNKDLIAFKKLSLAL